MLMFNLLVAFVAIQIVVSCPFANTELRGVAPNDAVHRRLDDKNESGSSEETPLFGTCTRKTVVNEAGIKKVYKEIKKEFHQIVQRSKELAQSDIFGAAIRLAFHDAGEIDITKSDSFGPDGCLSNTGPNSGLIQPETVVQSVFIPMWQKYCDRISRADFFVLLGKLAAERADLSRTINIPFQYGRKDNDFCDGGAGRLPAHQPGFSEFQRVFINQMGLTMNDAVALLGAHTVGHVHPQYSGFGNKDEANFFHVRYADNAWDETPEVFDNQYYKSLLMEFWQNDINPENPSLNTWNIARNTADLNGFEPPEGADADLFNEDAGGAIPLDGDVGAAVATDAAVTAALDPAAIAMDPADGGRRKLASRNFLHPRTIMLNADMVLGFPIHLDKDPATNTNTGVDGEVCGSLIGEDAALGCKSTKYGTVGGYPSTYYQVKKYSEDNSLFLKDYAAAYVKMVTVGYAVKPGAIKQGKLGTLKSIDLGPYWDADTIAFGATEGLASSAFAISSVPSYMISPYGDQDDICVKYDGVSVFVNGWPSTPHKTVPFVNAFHNPVDAIPSFQECRDDGHCIRSFEMDVKPVQARVWDQAVPACQNYPATWFLSYNGSLPGPTISIPTGHESLVRFNNKMPLTGPFSGTFEPCTAEHGRQGRPFSVHYHGSASLAPYDGWADDETCFDESKDYVYPNQRPNTGWYHDHALHITADNAYAGMAGFYVVSSKIKHGGCGEPWNMEDMEEKYMVLGDKLLDDQCQLRMEPKTIHERSFYGDIITVNGIPWPVMNVEPKWIRFRVLVASISRPFNYRIKTEAGVDVSKDICYVIASDGGYRKSPIPFPANGLLHGVAERYEFVCDFSKMKSKTLIMWNENDFDQMKDTPFYCYSHLIMKIVVGSEYTATTKPPVFNPNLAPDPQLMPVDIALSQKEVDQAVAMAETGKYHRRMDFGRRNGHWVINGETWDTFKIAAEDVGLNTWELWLFRTGGGWFHPIHMHLVDFIVIKRDGGNGVRTYEQMVGKDVFYLGPANNVYVLVRFGAHKGDYMFHCHNLIHEDNDMLRAFHMVDGNMGKTADTATQFIQNPLVNIIYSNYAYADPMYGETAAKPTVDKPVITKEFVRETLNKNLYRIFYPTAADYTLMNGAKDPWVAKVCPNPAF